MRHSESPRGGKNKQSPVGALDEACLGRRAQEQAFSMAPLPTAHAAATHIGSAVPLRVRAHPPVTTDVCTSQSPHVACGQQSRLKGVGGFHSEVGPVRRLRSPRAHLHPRLGLVGVALRALTLGHNVACAAATLCFVVRRAACVPTANFWGFGREPLAAPTSPIVGGASGPERLECADRPPMASRPWRRPHGVRRPRGQWRSHGLATGQSISSRLSRSRPSSGLATLFRRSSPQMAVCEYASVETRVDVIVRFVRRRSSFQSRLAAEWP